MGVGKGGIGFIAAGLVKVTVCPSGGGDGGGGGGIGGLNRGCGAVGITEGWVMEITGLGAVDGSSNCVIAPTGFEIEKKEKPIERIRAVNLFLIIENLLG